MEETITSRDNPQVKQVAALLTSRKERERSGLFVAEGLRLCVDAVESGVSIPVALLTREAMERYPETALLREKAGKTLLLSESLSAKISDTKHPQGVFAVCQKLDNRRSAVTIRGGGLYLLLGGIQDPGNLGTILRTADAMGVDGAFLGEGTTDLYSPKVLRGAMGGAFRLPLAIGGDLTEDIAALRSSGIPVYAAALTDGAASLEQTDFSGGGAVVVGNEGNGLPVHLIQACSGSVIIPMSAGANSLNAAVAAGILLWEMRRAKQTDKN